LFRGACAYAKAYAFVAARPTKSSKKDTDLQRVLDEFDFNAGRVIQRSGWRTEALKETIERAIGCLGDRDLSVFIDGGETNALAGKQRARAIVILLRQTATVAQGQPEY
jgi:hypothetical protein